MKNWQKDSIRKSIDNYAKTQDDEHLADIVRIYTYKKPSVGRRLAKYIFDLILSLNEVIINDY
ncbi:hypothetical protein ACWOBH_06075 [Globicatella sanguinis]